MFPGNSDRNADTRGSCVEVESMDKDISYSDEEIGKRRDAALLRALSTPHKKQADMKVGKTKAGKARRPKSESGAPTK